MKPTYAHELSERALKNYEILAKLEKDGEENIYTTTALISAMIFSVISLNEDIIDKDENYISPQIRGLSWPLEVKTYIYSDTNFFKFLNSLRNSIAHNDFCFLIEEKTEIVRGVSFHIKDEKENIDFFEEHLVSLLKCLTKLYGYYKIDYSYKYI